MKKGIRIAALILCIGLSFLWSHDIRRSSKGEITMIDFGEIYYGSRCALQHIDPYDAGAVLREFTAEGGKFSSIPKNRKIGQIVITVGVNLPTALFLAVPLASLPRPVAEEIVLGLIAGLLGLAAILICDLEESSAPAIWACLAGFILVNSEIVLLAGNVAGIAVTLCIISVWCFLKERYGLIGVLLLAFSLVLKPHDSGFIWLYFLMAGGALRKRAIQTLVAAGTIGLLAAIWLAQVSPHWISELHRNLVMVSVSGGTSDPGPTGLTWGSHGPINVQSAVSMLNNNPRFYDPVSYFMGGLPILVWLFFAIRKRFSPEGAKLGLAAISALSLVATYHRPYDAKLLLLTIPACATLWVGGGARRWIALALTVTGIFVTSDVMLGLLYGGMDAPPPTAPNLAGKIMSVLLYRPIPVVLLALGCFYLWAYIRHETVPVGTTQPDTADKEPTLAAAV